MVSLQMVPGRLILTSMTHELKVGQRLTVRAVKLLERLGMAARTFSPRTREAEPGLHSNPDSKDHRETQSQKTNSEEKQEVIFMTEV